LGKRCLVTSDKRHTKTDCIIDLLVGGGRERVRS